ncbi:GTP cyclohydrolase II [Roseovarius indicus]|uniref:GTP cyclohydrolase-2 n=1 Tax=Roseovarius indicus TaxID=540747 RepID=A0A0T5P5B5_9RHOB|nr:GTP cyclohydrolase II [Roseovarius indicus]KRS16256.1 GTP cyclohydrolase [Roseovarius indicus]OAO04954.1 GTP cyclohydrolase II [Roseovarius indicus]QEW27467.1 GTP cyclohydrolase-2 [Roseovarius indicus]SFD47741.1 GTP cyclohydrolase II [Roseovarius indicus]
MSLAPDLTEILARARSDLRMGVPVVLTGPEGALLVLAAETLEARRLADIKALGGPPVVVISARRAETLKARPYDGDLARIILPTDADLQWVLGVADPADDLRTPMKGPLVSERGGSADLHRLALKLAKSARLLPAVLVLPLKNAPAFSQERRLTVVDGVAAAPLLELASPLNPVVSARLPLEVSEAGKLHIFRPEDGGEEHYAIEIGQPPRDAPVLARLHSACFTGDLMGSLKCDCGPQLRGALAQMGEEGAGVLLYLNQEGRGIGLANKMRAYSLQDQGFDTVEANHRLGFEDDERDFRIGADILKRMGFSAVRLLTNNPAKIAMMQQNGIEVAERVPLKVGETAHNRAYLATKAKKSGHLL